MGTHKPIYEVNGNAAAAMLKIYRRLWPIWIELEAKKERARCDTD